MTHGDEAQAPPDSLSAKLRDLFDEDDETSSEDTFSEEAEAEDPPLKRPTDPPF